MAVENHYYSGQGTVLIGQRSAEGKPMGLVELGNVSALKIGVTTSTLEHKEAQTGQRAIDLRLTTETKASLSMTVENYIADNLAMALRASVTEKVAASIIGESVVAYPGKHSPLQHVGVSAVIPKVGALALVPYVNDLTPWDYKVNLSAGSLEFNKAEGGLGLLSRGATTTFPTGVTLGATTLITVTHNAIVGDKVYLSGFTGTDAGLLNGKVANVTAISTTVSLTVDIATTGGTITFASASVKVVGRKITAMAAGSTTSVTATNTAVAGDIAVLTGVTGASVNSMSFTVISATGAGVVLDVNTTGATLGFTLGVLTIVPASTTLSVDYSYQAQNLVDGLTEPMSELYMRFEGLNTADNNNPVVVEVFKFSTDPLKELSLIGDTINQFVLEGSVLADPLQSTGSKFFKQMLLR